MKRSTTSERCLVLAPRGRDAALAVAMLEEAGIAGRACVSLAELVGELDRGAGFVVATEEAVAGAELERLAAWLGDQEDWSDFPFVLLTYRGGIERNPQARRFLEVLGNVTLLERPFHPTTLVSLARSALRGRRRQYEARARLEALRAGEARYRALFDAIDAGFCIVELDYDATGAARDYRFVEVNPAFVRHTGLEDAVGRSMRELAPTHEQHWFDVYGEVARSGRPVRFDFEAKALGRHYDVHAFRAGSPAERRVAILFNDISARLAAEEQLREINETLEQRVAAEIGERARAEEQLRQAQKMEAVGQLTGGVAHDFNNLLTIIKSSTDLLRRRNLTEERRNRYIEAISHTVDRAAKLTGQLLAFARRQALKPETFDVGKRVRAVVDMLQTIVGARVRIVTRIAEGACHVEADLSQFETALVNMAVNARDAMNGEGTLIITVEALDALPAPRGQGNGAGDYVAVSLSDTGTGIEPDRLAQIFEPFFTTKEIGRGTGLGLSQVYGFAKQSGGDVGVESELGRGARFTLYLPRVDGRRAPQPGREEPVFPPQEAPGGGRVLLVEDNVEVGTYATQLLTDLGYETTWAPSADAALEALEAPAGFDAVFSDVVMPGMSGIELGREIRRRRPGLPVVLTSGYSHVLAEEGRHGFELLQKPYAVENLSRVLGRAIRGRRGN